MNSAVRFMLPKLIVLLLAGIVGPSLTGSLVVAGDQLKIKFIGMHGDRAKISVDRRIELVKPGASVKKGRVTLMSASKSHAILRVDGVNYLFKRNSSKGTLLPNEVVLARDTSGMFASQGAINGKTVVFIVDTGASFVSLSSEQPRKIKLRYKKNKPVKLQTASGNKTGYRTTLDSVRLGGIVQLDVDAVIIPGKFPRVILLGSTFLQGLRITQTEAFMKIAQ